MANVIDLCPQCRGKMVAIGERTGGFSAGKAVAGAVIAGPVGVAAGALGKQLVTLQCTKCGYTIETDAQTAKAAEEFGEAYEKYVNYRETQISKLPNLLSTYGYPPEARNAFRSFGSIHRKEERKKSASGRS